MITRDAPISQWVLCELLIANSPLSLDVLDEYSTYPLSTYLNNILMTYQSGLSSKSIAKANIEKEISLEEAMVREYVQRVSESSEEEVVCSRIKDAYTTAETNTKVKYQFPILIKEGRLTEAEQLLNEYTAVCSNDNYIEYGGIILDLASNEEGQVNPVVIESLISSGCNESISALVMSEVFTDNTPAFPSLVLPSESNKRKVGQSQVNERESLIQVSPNPAREYFYVSYDLPEYIQQNITVTIRDNNGKLINSKQLDILAGICFFTSTNFSKGTYLISIEINSKVYDSTKLIIQ